MAHKKRGNDFVTCWLTGTRQGVAWAGGLVGMGCSLCSHVAPSWWPGRGCLGCAVGLGSCPRPRGSLGPSVDQQVHFLFRDSGRWAVGPRDSAGRGEGNGLFLEGRLEASGLATMACGPTWPAVFVNKVLLAHSHIHSFPHRASSQPENWVVVTDCVACKAETFAEWACMER